MAGSGGADSGAPAAPELAKEGSQSSLRLPLDRVCGVTSRRNATYDI